MQSVTVAIEIEPRDIPALFCSRRLDSSRLDEYIAALAEAVQVSEPMDPEALADILDEASPDVAADVLRNIPPRSPKRPWSR